MLHRFKLLLALLLTVLGVGLASDASPASAHFYPSYNTQYNSSYTIALNHCRNTLGSSCGWVALRTHSTYGEHTRVFSWWWYYVAGGILNRCYVDYYLGHSNELWKVDGCYG